MAPDEQAIANHQDRAPSEEEDDTKSPERSSSPDPSKVKGKEKATSPDGTPPDQEEGGSESSSSSTPPPPGEMEAAPDTQSWQAIYASQYNMYYFYNTQTGETTWQNPLQPSDASASAEPSAGPSAESDPTSPDHEHPSDSASHHSALQAAALAQGIDPSLAHLDPSLLAAVSPGAPGPIPSFQAKFNARTGAFTRPDARTPGHLSEYERMKRMSEFYFDVNAWEQQIADDKTQEEEEGLGKKRKRPTKKDLERFKEQKRLKKIAKTAWLRT